VEVGGYVVGPWLGFALRLPMLSGTVPPCRYAAVVSSVVVVVVPGGAPPAGPPPLNSPAVDWQRVIGAGLVAGAVALVAGTLVEDFFTAGVGVGDDLPAFALASASVARGLQLLRGASVVLPMAAVPAVFGLAVRVGAAAVTGADGQAR
jgi:hypothetical protein